MEKSNNDMDFKQKIRGFLVFMFIISLVVCSLTIFIGSLDSFYSKVGLNIGDSIIISFLIGIVITIPLAIIFEKHSR